MATQDLSAHTELIDAVLRQERALRTEALHRAARRANEAQSRDMAFTNLTQAALLRLLKSDPEFAQGLDSMARLPNEQPTTATVTRPRAPELDPEVGRRIMTGGQPTTSILLQPPFQGNWAQATHSASNERPEWQANGTAQVELPDTLSLKGTIFKGDGLFRCEASRATFLRKAPGFPDGKGPDGMAWISPTITANCWWFDLPMFGITKVGAAVRVEVISFDMNGQNRVEEVNDPRVLWAQRGLMFGLEYNDSWDQPDTLTPFNRDIRAFVIRQNRLYMAVVYCEVLGSAQSMLRPGCLWGQLSAVVDGIEINQT